ncbi:MAG: DUF465 domain-containing protein [Alphaproteobacteria bacterium]|nr:MAG: DUF465 domain-containing protein [Alphaproteobacteria bacterium]
MNNAHYDLAHDLPEFKELIHVLKTSDGHFKHLFDEYNKVVKQIHRIESGVEQVADAVATEFKKQRLALKDEMLAMLQKASHGCCCNKQCSKDQAA